MQIRQSEINASLVNKLKPEDIGISAELCKRSATKNKIMMEIASKSNCKDCPEYSNCKYAFPEGNVSSDVMFIADPPSELDGIVHTSLFDASGRLLTVVLDKLGLKRDNIFVTNICKCAVNNDIIDDMAIICASRFIEREIVNVKPKLIITLGLTSANTVRELLLGLPIVTDIDSIRNQVFECTVEGHKCLVSHALSPEYVLTKNGTMYNKNKTDLWNDISIPFHKFQGLKTA